MRGDALRETGYLDKATEFDPKNARAGANLDLIYLLENKSERAAGIMQWYQLPETHRKDIYNQAERLSAKPTAGSGADSQPRKT